MINTLWKLNKWLVFNVGCLICLGIPSYAQPRVGKDISILGIRKTFDDSRLLDPNTRPVLLAESMLRLTKSLDNRDKDATHAMQLLQQEKIEMAIPLLVKKLDFISYYMDPRDPMASASDKYAAIKGLIGFGNVAIPQLVDSLVVEKENPQHWSNILEALLSLGNIRSEKQKQFFFYQQANRYDEQERFLRYLSKDITTLILQDNLVPKATEVKTSIFTDEQLRSCFEKSLLIWKAGPQPPVDLPIGAPIPPEKVEVPAAGAPTPEQIEKTILELGDLRCDYAIPALYRRLDFKVVRADESFYYPAVTALSQFGESAIEPLISQLDQPYQKQITYQNGLSVLVNLTGSEAKANEFLLKGADESKRRASYVRDMVER